MKNNNQNALNLNDDEKLAAEKADRLRLEGNECFGQNDFKKAVELYTLSLEAKKTVPALLNRSFSYTKMAKFDEALSDADEALKMDPNNLKGKCRRGIALRELGRYSLGLKEFGACLEREPGSANLQQLYDQCQALADQKSFVNMKLQIVGYKDTTKSKSEPSELTLELVDGLPCSQGIKEFRSLAQLGAHIKEHVKGAFGAIRIEDTVVDEEMMEFFRSLDPAMLASIQMEFFNVGCSRAYFAELFDGRLFRPLNIWFSQMERTEMDMTTALHSLVPVRNAMSLQLGETEFKRFLHKLDNGSNVRVVVDVDTVLELLHQPLPDIPAHIRSAPNFFVEQFSVDDSVHNGERTMTPIESLSMLRAMAGRTFDFDLHHFGDLTSGKLTEIIQKCTQRFRSAGSPVAYMLYLRIPFPPHLYLNPADVATLSKMFRCDDVMYNDVGEKLKVYVVRDTFEPGTQAITCIVQRVRALRPRSH